MFAGMIGVTVFGLIFTQCFMWSAAGEGRVRATQVAPDIPPSLQQTQSFETN